MTVISALLSERSEIDRYLVDLCRLLFWELLHLGTVADSAPIRLKTLASATRITRNSSGQILLVESGPDEMPKICSRLFAYKAQMRPRRIRAVVT